MSDSREVSAALVAALSELDNPAFDSTNPHFDSSFLSLAGMLDAVKPVLAKHGLVMLQPASTVNGMVQVQTVFLHASGQQVSFPPLGLPITEKTSAQNCGGLVSYLRRYSACAALGIAGQADDDGNAICPPPPDMYAPKARSHGNGRSAPVDAPQGIQASGGGIGSPKPSQARTAAPRAGNDQSRQDGSIRSLAGTVSYVKVTDGTGKNGKPYRKARVGIRPSDASNGTEIVYASTFNQADIALVEGAKESGEQVYADLRSGQYGDDLVGIELASARATLQEVDDVPF